MDIFELTVEKREPDGSRTARAIRRAGIVPAIVYGHGIAPITLQIKKSDLQKALHTKAGENVILNLGIPGVKLKESTCIIKDLQHHPVTGDVDHVDFTIISLKETIEVSVPLVLRSAENAVGVKEGGVLDVVHHELPIKCLPTQIPEKVEVDIKDLKIGDAIHLRDIKLPEGITCMLDANEVIIAIHAPHKEEEPKTETGEEPTQPEVIEKGKKEDAEEKAEPEEKKKAPEAKKE